MGSPLKLDAYVSDNKLTIKVSDTFLEFNKILEIYGGNYNSISFELRRNNVSSEDHISSLRDISEAINALSGQKKSHKAGEVIIKIGFYENELESCLRAISFYIKSNFYIKNLNIINSHDGNTAEKSKKIADLLDDFFILQHEMTRLNLLFHSVQMFPNPELLNFAEQLYFNFCGTKGNAYFSFVEEFCEIIKLNEKISYLSVAGINISLLCKLINSIRDNYYLKELVLPISTSADPCLVDEIEQLILRNKSLTKLTIPMSDNQRILNALEENTTLKEITLQTPSSLSNLLSRVDNLLNHNNSLVEINFPSRFVSFEGDDDRHHRSINEKIGRNIELTTTVRYARTKPITHNSKSWQ